MNFQLYPMGDHALLLEFGKVIDSEIHQQIQKVTNVLDHSPPSWMIEYIPAFTTITIIYKPTEILYKDACLELNKIVLNIEEHNEINQHIVPIPVCYGDEFGPDLEFVADVNNLTKEEVMNIHANGNYLVYMIGFSPGFPYIGGMSERIAAPRKKSPRLNIAAGSVGIAGKQTGIYSIDSPGGWQIIGRTPLRLFQIDKQKPAFLKAGDKIKFIPISRDEYHEWVNGQC